MRNVYTILANLLEYPGDRDDWAECLERAESLSLAGSSHGLLRNFLRDVQSTPVPLLQECYTQIFDLNPVCTLEAGYHLFGENYKRGLFLANLSETEKRHNVALNGQLPDYLPALLLLLDRMPEDELRADLISQCMVPALERMSQALGKSESPYAHLIAAVGELLKSEAGQSPNAKAVQAIHNFRGMS
ncbi:MAG: nitrate reductase molybdenum cofactor assembly chaperone [Acidimicrobiia bacterium]|nr:nitrate reductase molybdenum cofactor assembly chaperone [Acidimicrobiia bacterium]